MKPYLWILAGLCLIAFLVFKPFSETEHSETAPVIPSPSASLALTTPVPASAFNHRAFSRQRAISPDDENEPVNPRYTTPPKDSAIEFQVVGNLAVAYGDTILGNPEPNFDEDVGLAEVTRPQLWKSGEVPYLIEDDVVKPERIFKAIQLFHARTNVRFVPYNNQEDAIVFKHQKEDCMSYLGRTGGLQPVLLDDECGPIEIAHEMMHALGFVHEQSRTDRDQHVAIFWDNIQRQYHSQYAMVPEALMEVYGDSPFDSSSILMYEPHSFAINPDRETMKMKNGSPIQPAPTGLSELDIQRVNRLYRN